MAQEQTITGVRGLTSKTWYPRPPVEWGRAGGAVATISVGTATGEDGTGGGTDGAVANKDTTTLDLQQEEQYQLHRLVVVQVLL